MALLTEKKFDEVLERGFDLNVFISDRKGRKSSVAQSSLLRKAKRGHPFILIRSKTDESITENWLSDYMKEKVKKAGLTFWSEKADRNIQAIYFKDKNDRKFLYCYGLYLSVAEKYKSSFFEGFDKVDYIVWEECVPNAPLVQDSNYVRKKYMDKMSALLSIGSTIARNRKIQYILLGNDIAVNLINPVTVALDLLERLEPNVEIIDKCTIDDRDYTFYFNYFDFDGAVNHWLINKELDVSYDVKLKKPYKYDILVISSYKKYYILRGGGFIYITSKLPAEYKNNTIKFINSEEEFFAQYGAGDLLKRYNLHLALTMLQTFYNVSYAEIELYYGEYWHLDNTIKFTVPQSLSPQNIINLHEITQMELSSIINLPNFEKIKMLNELINQNTVIYENVKIKMLFEELKHILLFI